jgi:FkbM family methyltransferase
MKLRQPLTIRELAKPLINRLVRRFGVRIVGADWGPCGYPYCFERAKTLGFEPATIIDVGASDGRWTKECLTIFPGARYALFDPLAENVPSLTSLATQHRGISFWSGALGACAGRLQLNVHGHQTSFYPSKDFRGQPLDVEVRTLDSFIAPMMFSAPMIIKADVQGYEQEVLRGASRCLEMTEMLLLEVSFRHIYDRSPVAHEVIAELGGKGYRIYDICSYVQRGSDKALLQADMVFVRSSSELFRNEGWV